MWREWLIRLAMVTVSIVLVLLATELLLRAWWGNGLTEDDLRERLESSREASPDEARGPFSLYGLVQASDLPDVVYELKPHLDGTFRDQPIRTNSFGLRDDEIAVEKPLGTFRIVGLGDSHMFGWGVAQGEPWLDVAERTLNEAGAPRRFEVVNCAAPGYNTTMEVALFEHECRAFEPDLVVVSFVRNDFRLPHFLQPPRELSSVAQWYLAEVVRAALRPSEDDEIPDLLLHDRSELPAEVRDGARRRYEYMVGAEAFRRALERLDALTSEPPVPVIFAVVGTDDPETRQAVAMAEEQGFVVLDFGSALIAYLRDHRIAQNKAQWKKQFQLVGDSHPSPLAHRILGETFAAEVLQRL